MNGSTETSVADDQLAAFIDRILRMKEEADAIAADIREIYAEAKANGFDKTQLGNVVTYLRKKDKDAAKLEEGEAVFDLYLGSYLATKNLAPRVRAYARAGSGPEITEPQPAPQVEQGSDVAAEPVASRTIQPETANEAGDELVTSPGTAADHGETVNGNGAINSNAGGENGQVASALIETLPPGSQLGGLENNRDVTRADASELAFGSAVETSAPIPFTPKPLRPYCLNPGKCAGMGKKHCWACEKAHAEQQGAA